MFFCILLFEVTCTTFSKIKTKLKSQKDVEFIYTKIENVTKTEVEGCVQTKNVKSIIV